MKINADFNQPILIDTTRADWIDTRMPGVQRKMLDRIGAESGHATSIVRYAPDSYFPAHNHDGGEEFLVLEGIFSDEHRDYPAGSYVRNPIDTKHKPFSEAGCTIFVKLFQFELADKKQFLINTDKSQTTCDGNGVHRLSLHTFGAESVSMIYLDKAAQFSIENSFELLLLDGALTTADAQLSLGNWLRMPPGSNVNLLATEASQFYLKTGHIK